MVVVDIVLRPDCAQAISRRLVQASLFVATPAIALPAIRVDGPDSNHRKQAGDPAITVYQRLWDCCGVLLNEWDHTLTWSYDGSIVYNVTDQASWVAHVEGGPYGWYLKSNSFLLINGCSGCSYIDMDGEGTFGYIGAFDYTGQDYLNVYDDYDTGNANGTHSWAATYWWKKGFVGWHMQIWCC